MANKKIKDKNTIDLIVNDYNSGEAPANLARKYGVHPTTIRRYLRDTLKRDLGKISHTTIIKADVKNDLRRVLSSHKVSNIDALISELDKHFIIEKRVDSEDCFQVIHVERK